MIHTLSKRAHSLLSRPFSFRMKLILYISLLIITMITISNLLNYQVQKKVFVDEMQTQVEQMNREMLHRIDSRINEITKMGNYVVFHPYIEKLFTEHAENDSFYQLYLDQQELKSLTSQLHIDTPQLLSTYMFDMHGTNRNGNTFSIIPDEEITSLYHELTQRLAEHDRMIWLPAQFTYANKSFPVILNARWMKTKRLDTYGLLVFVFRDNLFTDLFRDNEQQQFILYNDEGEPLSHLLDDDLYELAAIQHEEQLSDNLPANLLPVTSISPSSQMKLLQFVSLAHLHEKTYLLLQLTLLSAGVATLLAIIMISLVSKQLLRPLRQLVQGMKQIRKGDLSIRIKADKGDEFAFINESFNASMQYIDELMKEVYQRKISEKEAVLKALQAQLNPHFLYNTLGSIYWKVYLQGDQETAQLIWSLSELLRYCLEPLDQPTTVNDEIEQINNYLNIQKIRFEQLNIEWDIQPQTLDIHMTRFLLQPIVENVFIHGFKNKTEDYQIKISSKLTASFLQIAIRDNGSGIPPEHIALLERESDQGIGLSSVRTRIELLHGKPYNVHITSSPMAGTTVLLKLPIHTNEYYKEA